MFPSKGNTAPAPPGSGETGACAPHGKPLLVHSTFRYVGIYIHFFPSCTPYLPLSIPFPDLTLFSTSSPFYLSNPYASPPPLHFSHSLPPLRTHHSLPSRPQPSLSLPRLCVSDSRPRGCVWAASISALPRQHTPRPFYVMLHLLFLLFLCLVSRGIPLTQG